MKRSILIVLALLLAAPAWALDLLDYIPDDQEYLLATSGGLVSDAYLASAMAAAPAGDEIVFPVGTLAFNAEWHVTARDHFIGKGGGLAGSAVTKLLFAANISGVLLEKDGIIFEGFYVKGSGTIGDGITLKNRASVMQVVVDGFGSNCIYVDGTTTNANGWFIEAVRAQGCGGNGLKIKGADSNAGLSIAFNAASNGDCGLSDESFLGNVHLSPQVASNVICSYRTTSNNATTLLLGAYEEGGQVRSLVAPTIVVGGVLSTRVLGNVQGIASKSLTPFSVVRTDERKLTLGLNNVADEFLDFEIEGDNAHSWSFYWNETLKTLEMRHARLDARVPFRLTTSLSTFTDEAGAAVGPGKMLMNGAWAKVTAVKYRYIDFKVQSDQVTAAAATITALQAALAALTTRVAALEAAP